jgi:tripartite-type tricarboxylate transporter receptor subunit TctC
MRATTLTVTLVIAVLAALPLSPVQAQSVADFYRGKSLNLYIGFSVGGAYDLYGRLVARHMGKHIPGNPNIIPQNMAGAGSLRVANFIYAAAPKDGTAFATMGRGAAFGPMFNQSGAAFDAQKYTWLGSANDEVSLCVSWHTSGVAKFEDILTKELIIAASGPTDETATVPRAINGILGTRMRVVTGYPGSPEMNLAMERGEVAGRCGLSWSSAKANLRQWLDEKKLQLLFQVSYAKHADLPDVPLIMDFAKTNEQRQLLRIFAARQVMGRPFLAPPDLPKDRADALRAAFMATLQDKEFLAEAEKAQLEITPVSGERVQALVDEVYATPPAIVKKAAEFVVQ